jgi:hypothetical protein
LQTPTAAMNISVISSNTISSPFIVNSEIFQTGHGKPGVWRLTGFFGKNRKLKKGRNLNIMNIVTCMKCDYRRGFGLVIGFIELLQIPDYKQL